MTGVLHRQTLRWVELRKLNARSKSTSHLSNASVAQAALASEGEAQNGDTLLPHSASSSDLLTKNISGQLNMGSKPPELNTHFSDDFLGWLSIFGSELEQGICTIQKLLD
ncbi:hypothetical protein Tcan_11127 [Toxocara canis]|uniref:Uncharacterized protein n=1 Tax=Toxocara canis TaxID=6265 RepID=A0A0B2V6J0_TOXCA|nr:hypothetical protein Tcan_11127 [Toxocara canis]